LIKESTSKKAERKSLGISLKSENAERVCREGKSTPSQERPISNRKWRTRMMKNAKNSRHPSFSTEEAQRGRTRTKRKQRDGRCTFKSPRKRMRSEEEVIE